MTYLRINARLAHRRTEGTAMTYLRINAGRASNTDRWRDDAAGKGRQDALAGVACDPARYGAKPGSAWAAWYEAAYRNQMRAEQ